jgi:hypothetical protein
LRQAGDVVLGERRGDIDAVGDLVGTTDHTREAAEHDVVDVVAFERGEARGSNCGSAADITVDPL